MKRSAINRAWRDAAACFARHHWALPPEPRWDITDFGLGDFGRFGLTLVNLATEPEYCEKLMYARRGQTTPCHTHARKKEDIICRAGELALRLWPAKPGAAQTPATAFAVPVNGACRASGTSSSPPATNASSAKFPRPTTTCTTTSSSIRPSAAFPQSKRTNRLRSALSRIDESPQRHHRRRQLDRRPR